MVMPQPHFLLFCDTHLAEARNSDWSEPSYARPASGRWHFLLERLDGTQRLEATDSESAVNRERLALLSVVRGLEALEQPSRVTLVTTSRYVSRGLRYGLSSWREADYKWERFGERKPVRNADLWRRVDAALGYHGVQCRLIQSEGRDEPMSGHDISSDVPEPLNSDVDLNALASFNSNSNQAAQLALSAALRVDSDLVTSVPRSALPTAIGQSSGVKCGIVVENLTAAGLRVSCLDCLRRFATLFDLSWAANGWGLTLACFKWWRGKLQAGPGFYGA